MITSKFCCYPPQGEGNVFTSVCLFGGGIVCLVTSSFLVTGPMSFPGGWVFLVPCPSQGVGYFITCPFQGVGYPWGQYPGSMVYHTPPTHPAQRRPLPRLVCILLEYFLVLITTRKQSLRRLCFYRWSVCPQGVCHRPWPDTPPPSARRDTAHPPPPPPPPWILRDTVNKRVVCIPFLLFEFVIANHCNMAKCIGFYIQLQKRSFDLFCI